MSGDRRSRSRSLRRRSYSRSRSRNRSKSADKAKQPCVFYFSKEAKGCKFSGRDCKFSHDKYDYENWNKDGKFSIQGHSPQRKAFLASFGAINCCRTQLIFRTRLAKYWLDLSRNTSVSIRPTTFKITISKTILLPLKISITIPVS